MDLHWVVTRRRQASDGRVGSITVCERCMEVAKMCIPFPPIMYIVYIYISNMYVYIYMYRCLVSSHFLVLNSSKATRVQTTYPSSVASGAQILALWNSEAVAQDMVDTKLDSMSRATHA